MNQIVALFVDAYRELNSKRLFWVVLILSGFVCAAFAAVGLTPRFVTLFGYETPFEFGTNFFPRPLFYKMLFVTLGIQLWLAWIAIALALVSTAGIYPDLLTGGAIDLYLSKPIGRLKLFLVKYACGLLFVGMQVAVFSLGCFLVFGLRAGIWLPGLFWAVPIVVLVFSYLYAVCVLMGVLTRSTVGALLLTVLFWFALWAAHTTEIGLLQAKLGDEIRARQLDEEIAQTRQTLAKMPTTAPATQAAAAAAAATRPSDSALGRIVPSIRSIFGAAPKPDPTRAILEARIDGLRSERDGIHFKFATPHRVAYALVTALPKTSETVDLLQRVLVSKAELPAVAEEADGGGGGQPNNRAFRVRRRNARIVRSLDAAINGRPVSWVVGTSLGFEAAVLGIAAWAFCRRDY